MAVDKHFGITVCYTRLSSGRDGCLGDAHSCRLCVCVCLAGVWAWQGQKIGVVEQDGWEGKVCYRMPVSVLRWVSVGQVWHVTLSP